MNNRDHLVGRPTRVFIITLVAFICYFQKTRKAKKMRELSNLGFKKNFD